jgi:hypothetical protein
MKVLHEEDRLSVLKHKMEEKGKDCIALRRVLKQIVNEYTLLEHEWFTKSRQITAEREADAH